MRVSVSYLRFLSEKSSNEFDRKHFADAADLIERLQYSKTNSTNDLIQRLRIFNENRKCECNKLNYSKPCDLCSDMIIAANELSILKSMTELMAGFISTLDGFDIINPNQIYQDFRDEAMEINRNKK